MAGSGSKSSGGRNRGRNRGGRSGGPAARRALRSGGGLQEAMAVVRKIPTFKLWSEEALDIIEINAETILAEIGIDFRGDPEILALWADAGADVNGERVRFPRGLCRKLLQTAPSSFEQIARNPARNVTIGGDHMVFAPVYGPPFVLDLEGKRRYATLADFENFVKLTYLAPSLQHSGGTICEPVDVPVAKRHLDMIYAHMRLSDKPFMGSVTAEERAADTVAMAEILYGETRLRNEVAIISLINANSPLVFDGTMLGAMKVYARAGQACIVAPFMLSGAMAPVTVAGSLTIALAEALAGGALTQVLRPGAPVVLGSFISSMSMRSGTPTFGTPEPALVVHGFADLVRRLGLPVRAGGALSASKLPDAQAAYESAHTMAPTINSGINFILHAAGWLEGGLVASYEKFIMDADQAALSQVYLKGVAMDIEAQAMDAIREVGPGNHFLGCAHTQAHFETAFSTSTVADNNSFEQWQADGAMDTPQRARKLCQDMLSSYEAPPLDPAIDEELRDFIARRKDVLPDGVV